MDWKLERDVAAACEAKGLVVRRVSGGNSPYSAFDLLALAEGASFEVPASYTVSPMAVKSADPATAYKGRHATGRLILVQPADAGLVKVTSGGGDEVVLTLADGTSIGRKTACTLGDLFPGLEL